MLKEVRSPVWGQVHLGRCPTISDTSSASSIIVPLCHVGLQRRTRWNGMSCSDETGTLTQNIMTFVSMLPWCAISEYSCCCLPCWLRLDAECEGFQVQETVQADLTVTHLSTHPLCASWHRHPAIKEKEKMRMIPLQTNPLVPRVLGIRVSPACVLIGGEEFSCEIRWRDHWLGRRDFWVK